MNSTTTNSTGNSTGFEEDTFGTEGYTYQVALMSFTLLFAIWTCKKIMSSLPPNRARRAPDRARRAARPSQRLLRLRGGSSAATDPVRHPQPEPQPELVRHQHRELVRGTARRVTGRRRVLYLEDYATKGRSGFLVANQYLAPETVLLSGCYLDTTHRQVTELDHVARNVITFATGYGNFFLGEKYSAHHNPLHYIYDCPPSSYRLYRLSNADIITYADYKGTQLAVRVKVAISEGEMFYAEYTMNLMRILGLTDADTASLGRGLPLGHRAAMRRMDEACDT